MWCYIILALVFCCLVGGPKVDPLRASVTNEEQRAFIKCHVLLKTTAAEVNRMLKKIPGRNALVQSHVYRLYREFNDRTRLSSEIEHGGGRERAATDQEHAEK